jgi:hypothetical protein
MAKLLQNIRNEEAESGCQAYILVEEVFEVTDTTSIVGTLLLKTFWDKENSRGNIWTGYIICWITQIRWYMITIKTNLANHGTSLPDY